MGTWLIVLVLALLAGAFAQEIRIEVGDAPSAVVAGSPGGSTFVFAPGVHRMTKAISPRQGDVFRGEDGAILNGSVVLEASAFTSSNGLWAVEVSPRASARNGDCQTGWPRCEVAVDLYLDDRPLRHVGQRDYVRSGQWYLDMETRTAYMADDPDGRKVEFSIAEGAVMGAANNVTVENLVIEKFANMAQRGVVHAFRGDVQIRPEDRLPPTPGQDWVVRGNTIRLNHGVGINASRAPRIVDNTIVDNGQLGILVVGGSDAWIEGNEIARNNYAGFEFHWEAGGAKFIRTTRLTVRDNHVHGNQGPGLWADMDNIDTLYEDNVIEHNATTGIFHETSYEAIIRGNLVRFNGVNIGELRYAYVFGSGILVYNSRDVEVVDNIVVGNWNGINGLHHERGIGAYGPYELRNLRVHDNVIHMGYHPEGMGPTDQPGSAGGMQAVSGVSQAGGFHEIFSSDFDNRFFDNVYLIEDPDRSHWTWDDRRVLFEEWTRCAYAYNYWLGCRQDEESQVQVVDGPEEALRIAEERSN